MAALLICGEFFCRVPFVFHEMTTSVWKLTCWGELSSALRQRWCSGDEDCDDGSLGDEYSSLVMTPMGRSFEGM